MADQTTSVFKYLDINKSREATIDESRNNVKPFDKYYGLRKAREIKKIPKVFTLVARSYNVPVIDQAPRLVFQFNVTMPENFYILQFLWSNLGIVPQNLACANGQMYVKFRVGTTVYRYAINQFGSGINPITRVLLPQYPNYINQLIGKNCCFEFWSHDDGASAPTGMLGNLTIRTSLYNNPASVEETEVIYAQNASLEIAAIGVAIPEALPYNQANIAFNDNII